jgi:hypothetical protein
MFVALLLPAISQTAAFTMSAEISFDSSGFIAQNRSRMPFQEGAKG